MQSIIYARISKDRDGEGLGVARQEADARALAQQRGWEVLDTVVDNDTSAAGRRPRAGFELVLEAIESGRAQVVIAWALDRLTRNRRDTVRLIEACQRHGATIALVRGSDLDMATPAGRLTADLLAAVARSEIEVKSDRQARAALQAAEQGRWVGGRRPFGYEADGMTVREAEAKCVRDAYTSLLDGISLRQIAYRWNEAGMLPPQGSRDGSTSRWTGSVVSRCLRKPRYAGLSSRRGEVLGVAQWPALVDADTWHAAQAMMRNPSRTPTRGDQRMLSGLALCGTCGATVHAGGGATGRGVYRCSVGSHVVRRRAPIDELISAVVVERLGRPDAGRIFAARAAGVGAAELLREAEELRQRLDGLSEGYADGALTLSQLRKGTDRLRGRLEEVEKRIAATGSGPSADLRNLLTATEVGEVWDSLDVAGRRSVIEQLMTITLYPPGRGVTVLRPEHVRIDWRTS
ncbi:Site-specific DNA recombinase [Friedmanniella luteola]|uniref:Site-specific DNA recombinase n=1 Tax=Friedmanniella luteola TaxID=546871 RepID=A0A1H1QEZ7_9ACTN|nr:recombinase family protein [Friedmanniella luteola]SDS21469.1 Site-specific DNA recombinase [Friedmanniella luteola]